jgi:hypothetical protein
VIEHVTEGGVTTLEQATSRRNQMSKATKTRRAVFGVLPVIALVLGYQEVSMSQAKANWTATSSRCSSRTSTWATTGRKYLERIVDETNQPTP